MLRLVGTEFADRLRDRAERRGERAESPILVVLGRIADTLERMTQGLPATEAGREPPAPGGAGAVSPIDYDLDAWANDRRRRNKRNVDDDRARLALIVKGCGWRSIDDASPDSLMVYLAAKRESGWKGHTLNKAVCLVSTLLDDVGRRAPHRCPVNWAKGLPRASTDDGDDGSRALTWAEFLALCESVRKRAPDRFTVYTLLGYTGIRYSEARMLDCAEVRMEGNPRLLLTRRTKSRKSRSIPLASEVLPLIRSLVGKRKAGPVFAAFPTIRTLRNDCEAAKVTAMYQDPSIGFHSLRKCFAGRCAMTGVPLAVAQKLLGHSDPKLTSNIYSHFTDGDLAQEVARLGGTQKKVSLNGTKSLDEAGALDDDVPVTPSNAPMQQTHPQHDEARPVAERRGGVTIPSMETPGRASTGSGDSHASGRPESPSIGNDRSGASGRTRGDRGRSSGMSASVRREDGQDQQNSPSVRESDPSNQVNQPRDIAGKGTEKSHLRDLNPGPMLYESTGRGLPERAEAVAQVLDAIARLLREPADDREHKEAV